jgi:hypothetical protein
MAGKKYGCQVSGTIGAWRNASAAAIVANTTAGTSGP